MAGASLLTLFDDIASVLDDVSVLTKVAARKTAGVLGDDLALNAQQVSGVNARHELPVVWAVFKGSALNKCILVPAALAISAFAPWLVTPLLMLGGLYLCYEGVEKLVHKYRHGDEGTSGSEAHGAAASRPAASGVAASGVAASGPAASGGLASGAVESAPTMSGEAAYRAPTARSAEKAAHLEASKRSAADAVAGLGAPERQKIKGAIRTDFILSAEIIAITLGTVAGQPFLTQLAVLVGIATIMTVGVYGLVAGIVKLDDGGLYLSQRSGAGTAAQLARKLGFGILAAAPWLMKILSIVGTAAMFLVGGGILTHGVGAVHHWIEGVAEDTAALPGVGAVLGPLTPMLLNAVAGILAGAAALLVVMLATRAIAAVRS